MGCLLLSLGRLHPTRGTPVRAIVLQAVLGSVLVVLGSFGRHRGVFHLRDGGVHRAHRRGTFQAPT